MAGPARTPLFSRHQPGGVNTIYDIEKHPGNIYFIDSVTGTNAAGHGYTVEDPIASIAYAFSSVAVAGDVFYVLPTHTESLSGVAAIAANVASVRIIGMGWGAYRPTLTWHTTDATIAVSVANVEFKNIRCTVDVDEVVSMWNITGAGFTLDGVDYIDATSTQAIQFLLTTSAANQLTIKNCNHQMLTAPAATSVWISLIGCSGARILDNFFRLVLANAAGAFTIGGGTDPPYAEIGRNVIIQTGGTTQAAAISLTTGTGCFVHDNRAAVGSTALPGIIAVGTAGYAAENYVLNTANKSGIIDPVADA
jgi:hypothetical protein